MSWIVVFSFITQRSYHTHSCLHLLCVNVCVAAAWWRLESKWARGAEVTPGNRPTAPRRAVALSSTARVSLLSSPLWTFRHAQYTITLTCMPNDRIHKQKEAIEPSRISLKETDNITCKELPLSFIGFCTGGWVDCSKRWRFNLA